MHPECSLGTRFTVQCQKRQDVIGRNRSVSRDVQVAERQATKFRKQGQNVGGPMQAVAIGFVISVVQDSTETALNSSTDVLFTAAACRARKPD